MAGSEGEKALERGDLLQVRLPSVLSQRPSASLLWTSHPMIVELIRRGYKR